MSDKPSEVQSNEDTLRILSEQNVDLVGYIQEYQQKVADEQFANIQMRRTIAKLEAKVSDLEDRLVSSSVQGESHEK